MMIATGTLPPAEAPAPDSQHRTPGWRRFWVVLAALALVLGGLAISKATRKGDSANAFSWDGDNIAEWVSEDEMADALKDILTLHAEGDADGEIAFEEDPAVPDGRQWIYRQREGEGWRVDAHDGDHAGRTADIVLTKTDPRLPDGVIYEPGWGWGHGSYIFSGPNSDESICINVWPPGEYLPYPRASQVNAHEDRVFALASVMLREMGWAD